MIYISIRFDEPNLKRKNPFTHSSSNNKLTNYTIGKEPTSERNATNILALNDDCLFEMFKYLGVLDLSSISDTCTRFKQTAKAYFAYSKKKKLDLVNDEIFSRGDTIQHLTSKTSRVLRNFGEFIVGFFERGMVGRCACKNLSSSDHFYRRTVIELLVLYSGQSLRELELTGFFMADANAHAMEPLIERLHTFSIDHSKVETTFWNRDSWFSQLQELRLNCNFKSCEFLHRPFPKLVKIVLHSLDLHGSDMVKMLKHNPQLKEIDIRQFGEMISFDDLLPSIAAHVPEIESLHIRLANGMIRTDIHKYFGQLRKLSALTVEHPKKSEGFYVSHAILVMVRKNVPLKYVSLLRVHFNRLNAFIFEKTVPQLKQLETLKLVAVTGYLKLSHIHKVCQRCNELSRLLLCVKHVPTLDDISQMIRNATNLRWLSIEPTVRGQVAQICVNTDVYKEWLQIVENRREKTHLKIELYDVYYTTTVPNDLVTAHQKTLSVVYTQSLYYDRRSKFV